MGWTEKATIPRMPYVPVGQSQPGDPGDQPGDPMQEEAAEAPAAMMRLKVKPYLNRKRNCFA